MVRLELSMRQLYSETEKHIRKLREQLGESDPLAQEACCIDAEVNGIIHQFNAILRAWRGDGDV